MPISRGFLSVNTYYFLYEGVNYYYILSSCVEKNLFNAAQVAWLLRRVPTAWLTIADLFSTAHRIPYTYRHAEYKTAAKSICKRTVTAATFCFGRKRTNYHRKSLNVISLPAKTSYISFLL